MLIILLIFALIRSLRGVPLSSPCELPDGCLPLDIRDSQSHFGERAVSDIILSCFATIFACTWTAVHPNVPAPTDCAWARFKRQFVTMLYALLAPEAITAWALRQRLGARMIADYYNREMGRDASPETQPTSIIGNIRAIFQDSLPPRMLKDNEVPRWTLAHGFFLQMGGFMLSEGGRPIQTLAIYWSRPWEALWNIEDNIIVDAPLITEEDIKDRSKGDAISKTLIILQTTWFIVQCIARWVNHLSVIELEVVTLGFAMLNGITYVLWWHKPQNVGRPVFLEIKREMPQGGSNDTRTATISKPSYWRRVRFDFGFYVSSKPWKLLYLLPLYVIRGLLRPLGKLVSYEIMGVEHIDRRVPMFYSFGRSNSTVYKMTTIICILFGSVHLIPSWFLHFPSVQEMWLWRGSAIVITVGPVFLAFTEYNQTWKILNASGLLLIMILPLYIFARIILLTISLTSLRSLSPAALQTVKWTTFIPHI